MRRSWRISCCGRLHDADPRLAVSNLCGTPAHDGLMRTVSFTPNNQLQLLHCGAEFFPELLRACESARSEIVLETYIFAEDDTGIEVIAALRRAVARGVSVKVITDWIGTGPQTCEALREAFAAAGVQYRVFNPWFRRGLARTHRKICVVDADTAFLGGLNINDDLLSDDGSQVRLPAPRWDFAIRVRGPLVSAIHREVLLQWERLGPRDLRMRWRALQRTRSAHVETGNAPSLAALVVRDTLRNRRTIQRAYLHALGHARESALLANPYFAPSRKMRVALCAAARRGVRVTLLLGTGQFRMQDAVARSYYPKLLRSGVQIVEYRRTALHGKVAVVDDNWSTVGSSNVDGLSLFINHEANIVVRDEAFAGELRRHIERGVAEGVPVRAEAFSHIAWYRRAWYGVAFFLYRNVMRLLTGGEYG